MKAKFSSSKNPNNHPNPDHHQKMSVKIDDLPEEVLVLIFRRFDLLEKLKLRLVCLGWKRIIEGLRVLDISIVDSSFNRCEKRNWTGLQLLNFQNLIYWDPGLSHTLTSLFGADGLISQKKLGSLELVSKQSMFSRVKSMFISFVSVENFCFEKFINPHFPQLEQLSCIRLNLSRKTCLISLPNLRVLFLLGIWRMEYGFWRSKRIRLELPRMYKLVSSESLYSFQFVYPQAVTHLYSGDDHESISRLTNLEYFSCFKLRNESVTFCNLPKLKEIHLYSFFQKNPTKRFAVINQTRKRLGRYELKMFVDQIEYQAYLSLPKLSSKELIMCFASGKMSPSMLPIRTVILFDFLLDALGDRAIPAEFKSVFSNLIEIQAFERTKENVDLFFKLLGCYPNIHALCLRSPFAGLNDQQAIYNSLPFCCKYLRELFLFFTDKKTFINLRFILEFGYLEKLKINTPLKSNYVGLLFGELKYFRWLEVLGQVAKLRRQIKIIKLSGLGIQTFIIKANQDNPQTFYIFRSLLAFYREWIEQNVDSKLPK